jgi:ribosomal protein S12
LPTINQLVRHPRKNPGTKTKSPALRWRYNALHNKTTWTKGSPQKRGV